MREVAAAIAKGELNAAIRLVVSNRADCLAIAWADETGIDTLVIDSDQAASDRLCLRALKIRNIDLVLLTGYLRKIGPEVLAAYDRRMLNLHPSLLPKFGGKGMYGNRVHDAVLKAGETETGASVHIVDAEYDTGPVIAQKRIRVRHDDSPQQLAERVKSAEAVLLIDLLSDLSKGGAAGNG